MDAGIEVKVESDDEMEPYDGSYACLICTESVRGQPALVCSTCNSNPFHRTCDPESKYAEVCPVCGQKTVEAWQGGRAGGSGGGRSLPSSHVAARYGWANGTSDATRTVYLRES